MEQGIILKGVGGTYVVQTSQGRVACTLRGKLRLKDSRVLVGDRVEVSLSADGKSGVVEAVLPRKSELIRPPIANVDQVLVVFAVQNPEPNYLLLDRILVQAELMNLGIVIVLNKGDLNPSLAEELRTAYSNISYPTFVTSATEKKGLGEIRELLQGKISTLAGPSGVGKSSLLNALNPDLNLETGEVSVKLQRGRHTTRTVELISFGHGYVADTPGFSNLTLEPDQEANLQFAFPEIAKCAQDCHFRSCLHRHEPNCAVKEAVVHGQILERRYNNYLTLLEEVAPRY
ncbi:MAG: ribosome small subunit-dependent GTPase A [Firmicutes bacterium]|nr:ribosome small subunit-dependent GTPase A [Bacillota bacterium]